MFTPTGAEIKCFNDITHSTQIIIVSETGKFLGLENPFRPKDMTERRILNEKQTRENMNDYIKTWHNDNFQG